MPWRNNPPMTLQAVEDCLAQTVPTRVLLIDQGASKADREAVDEWIDQRADHRVLCWHYNPPLPSLSACWNRALKFVWELGGTEALVVNNDVRLAPRTVELLAMVLTGEHALFVSAVGVKDGQFDSATAADHLSTTGSDGEEQLAKGGPDFSCFLLSREGHEKYPFDESLTPCYTEDVSMHREYMLGGNGTRIFSVNLPFLHYASGTIKAMTKEEKQTFDRGYQQVVTRYTQLWGGGPNQETFTIKGDPGSAREGVTTPELQRRVQAGEPAVPYEPINYEELERAYQACVVGQFLPDGSTNPEWVPPVGWVAPDPRD